VIVINGCSPATGTHHAKARIAEEAGACAVMALERVPADIRSEGGVARMASARLGRHPSMVLKNVCLLCISPFQSDPRMIKEIVEAVSIPVMAKVRIGHFVEAQVAILPVK
jgi:pyridoxal 5'-phosphate synthase pdxS subunit